MQWGRKGIFSFRDNNFFFCLFIILGFMIMSIIDDADNKSEGLWDSRKTTWLLVCLLPVTVEASLYCLVLYDVDEKLDGRPMLCFSRVAFTVGENIDENRSYNKKCTNCRYKIGAIRLKNSFARFHVN